jgi:hypothetical protein
MVHLSGPCHEHVYLSRVLPSGCLPTQTHAPCARHTHNRNNRLTWTDGRPFAEVVLLPRVTLWNNASLSFRIFWSLFFFPDSVYTSQCTGLMVMTRREPWLFRPSSPWISFHPTRAPCSCMNKFSSFVPCTVALGCSRHDCLSSNVSRPERTIGTGSRSVSRLPSWTDKACSCKRRSPPVC